jgi:hypothetical protein
MLSQFMILNPKTFVYYKEQIIFQDNGKFNTYNSLHNLKNNFLYDYKIIKEFSNS